MLYPFVWWNFLFLLKSLLEFHIYSLPSIAMLIDDLLTFLSRFGEIAIHDVYNYLCLFVISTRCVRAIAFSQRFNNHHLWYGRVYSHMRGLRRNCLRLPSEYRDVSRKTHARCAESERERAMRNKSQRSRMVAFERKLKMDIAPRVQEAWASNLCRALKQEESFNRIIAS